MKHLVSNVHELSLIILIFDKKNLMGEKLKLRATVNSLHYFFATLTSASARIILSQENVALILKINSAF